MKYSDKPIREFAPTDDPARDAEKARLVASYERAALAASPGRVLSRVQLLEKVWGYDFYGDERVVDVHIRTMRKALGDDPLEPRYIATVRGVGYKFLPGRPR